MDENNNDTMTTFPLGTVGTPAAIATIPAVAMGIGFVIVCWCRPSRIVQAVFQNLSAGLIIASVAGELFPLLDLDMEKGQKDWTNTLGLILGFLLGIAVMFTLDKVLDMCEGDDDDGDGEDMEAALITDDTDNLDLVDRSPSRGEDVDVSDVHVGGSVHATLREKFGAIIATIQGIKLTSRADVDEAVHRLQAFVHASRRSLYQSETDILSDREQRSLRRSMDKLLANARHLQGDLTLGDTRVDGESSTEDDLETEAMKKEILQHILDFEKQVDAVEREVEVGPVAHKLRRWKVLRTEPEDVDDKPQSIPWSFVVAVCVDSFVDGCLIGLSYMAKPSAGLIMAGATCIEMHFLGITFSGTLRGPARTMAKLAGICSVPLVLLTLGGAMAGLIGSAIPKTHPVFEGLIAFCVVALLFLVTQELLVQAYKNTGGKEIAWVNLMIFIGIFIVILVARITSSFP